MEYAIEKPSTKRLSVTELDSDTWVAEVKRIRGKKQPFPSACLHALRDEYTGTLEPARALAADTLTLERTHCDLVNQAYGLTAKGESSVAFDEVLGYISLHGQRDSSKRSPQAPSLRASTDY